jgi:hypothetical protein
MTNPTFYWRIRRELSVEAYIRTQAAAICPFQVFLLFIIELCCENYFEASGVVWRFSLCGEMEEALDELRLAHHVIPV